jgi:hypothetical protein
VRYQGDRPDDAAVRARMRELATIAAGSVIAVCSF